MFTEVLGLSAVTRKGKVKLPKGFRALRMLGQGNASEVWAVRHDAFDDELALKITTGPDPGRLLEREYAILKRLDHPGIVKVIESGEYEGRGYFSMELIRGKSFTDFLTGGRKSQDFIDIFLEVLVKTAISLTDLHKQGIVHLDLKPSNLLIKDAREESGGVSGGTPVFLDFGFAEDYMLSPTAEPSGTTLDYAAPELFSGGRVTPAADIYSLGAMAYEVLTGGKLWSGKPLRELIASKFRTPPGLGKLDIELPAGLEGLILRMINPEPSLRPSAHEVISEIGWIRGGEKSDVPAPAMVPRLVFGGRDDEIATIEKFIFDEKRIVLLSGESGAGKTRLLRELRFKAILSGKSVLYLEGRGAHLSLVDCLYASLDTGQPGSSDKVDQPSDKWSRYERIFQAIEKGGFDGVYIDAALNLTEDEENLLGYLSRGFDAKLGVLLSQVQESVFPKAAKLVLQNLSPEKVMTLVSRTFKGLENESGLSKTLSSIGGGNPRNTNELLDILYNENWLSWKRGWRYEPLRGEGVLSARLERWQAERIGGLDNYERLALNSLALVESALPVEVLSDMVGERAPLVIKNLAEKGLIRSFLSHGRPHYEFADDVTRPYLLASLRNKRSLGKTLARVLVRNARRRWGKDPGDWDIEYLLNVADIYNVPGIVSDSSLYLAKAGLRLSAEGNNYSIERGRRLLLRAAKSDNAEKKHVLYELGRIALLKEDYMEARRFYRKSMLLETKAEEKARILANIAITYQKETRVKQANSYARLARESCRNPSPETRALILYTIARNAYLENKFDEAISYFEECLRINSTPVDMIRADLDLGALFNQMGNPQKALKHLKRALGASEKSGNTLFLIPIMITLSSVFEKLGLTEDKEEALDKGISLLKSSYTPFELSNLMANKSLSLAMKGDFTQALSLVRQAKQQLNKTGDKYAIARLRTREAEYVRELGDMVHANEIFRELWRDVHDSSDTSLRIITGWAIMYRMKGEYFISSRLLKKSRLIAESLNNVAMLQFVDIQLCKLYINLNDVEEARVIVDRLRQQKELQGHFLGKLTVDVCHVNVLNMSGEHEKAIEAATEILAVVEGRKELEITKQDALNIIGKSLIALGRVEEGMARLKEAEEMVKG